MMKRIVALALSGALLCVMSVSAFASEAMEPLISSATATEESQPLPDSVLYYGQIKEIVSSEEGAISRLVLDSEASGEYIMNLSEDTVWIDSGNRTADDPSDLTEGERVYVFHSPVSTRSIPPQSAAFAIVRNVPEDAGCALYHEVERIDTEDGMLLITTDNGGLILSADKNTEVSSYFPGTSAALADVKEGAYIMAWYQSVAASYPGQAYATQIMLLPQRNKEDTDPLTRADFVTMLHELAGKPVVNYAMQYTDVEGEDVFAEAIRWATSEGLVGGYQNGGFGPEDVLSREQLVTILWRHAGSPILADYAGLAQYGDAGSISAFARQAMAWAHQQGLLSNLEDGLLAPQGAATKAEAEQMLQKIDL